MDLQTLSRKNKAVSTPAGNNADASRGVPPPRRRWVTRLALPLVIVLATLALIGYAARDLILPATEVSIVRASAIAGQPAPGGGSEGAQPPAGRAVVVAQAPGWVEPDPYPIYVTTLADGVVARVNVLEGETVEAGQTLVELVDEDAALALAQARAELARREAALTAAQTDLDEPVALRRGVAVTRAALAEAEAALTRLDAEVAKEDARLAELVAAYVRLQKMSEASVSALQIDAAKYQAQSQQAVVEATRQRRPGLEAAVDAARAERDAARRDYELKTELLRKRDEAAAEVQAAQVRVEQAELRHRRMTIKSPADGIVMARLVAPGDKLMLGMDEKHSAHAIHLYDPQSLQVRVDVPLADAASVGAGQQAIIVVDVLPDVEFAGVVTRLVHRADIAKNTVQFKVAITDPSPLLKPDMLARVKFLGRANGTATTGPTRNASAIGGAPVAVRRSAVVEGGGEGPFVWWVSPIDNRLQRRPVTLGAERGDGVVTVSSGLNPGDVVVDAPDASLQAGQRVRVRDGNE